MAGLLDFFSPEAGQRRTAALGGLVDRAEYYVPPELRSILGFAGEMSPVAGLQRAGQASERMLDPSRTGGQRFGDLGEMLSETAGVAAPMAVAGRAGVPVAKAIQEGLLGFSAGADDVGRRVLDRLNQPGPVPTMYSNPLGGAKPKSTSPAQEVAGLLSSGRADEVTDEMLAKFTPKDEMEIFDLYQRGATGMDLPMDEASRLARAEEAGFENLLYYHGTDAPEITAFYPSMGAEGLPATFLTDSRRVAETYGDNVGEYFARYDNPAEFYFDGGSSTYFDNESLFPGGLVRRIKEATDDAARYGSEVDTDLAFDLQSAGVDPMFADEIDAVKMRNVVDDFGWGGSPANNVAIYDPANIRRRSARFDPRLSHLRNLSAGVGGMGLLGMSYPQEEQY